MNESDQLSSCINGMDTGDQFNFKCTFCGKNLSSRQNLKEHMYTHTGTKPYVCNEPGCGKSFRQGSLLSIHKKVHLDIDEGIKREKRPYKKIEYPKLTILVMHTLNSVHKTLSELEKQEWMNRIDINEFQFLKKFIEHNEI